jgi:hypothetical protein
VRFSGNVGCLASSSRRLRRSAAALTFVALALLNGASPRAHEIPNDVTVQTFVRPEGQRLRILLRVPLAAMRDLDYPRRGGVSSGLLDISRADSTLRDAATLWVGDFLDVYEDGAKLPYPKVAAVMASVQADPSFVSYDSALGHVLGPRLPGDTEFVWTQGLLDVLFEFPIQSDQSRFSVDPRFARLGIRTLTIVRFLPPSGDVRLFELDGDAGVVRLDPRTGQAVRQFGLLGFKRLVGGVEELLLLVCLVLPFRRPAAAASIALSFAVASSMALAASTFGLAPDALWFRPLVGTLVAASVLCASLEDIVGTNLDRRRLLAFAAGLVFGFSSSFDLKQSLQFAGVHPLAALLAYDTGLVLGQLAVLAVVVPALVLTVRYLVDERLTTLIVAALIAHSAWHWTVDRGDLLRRYRFVWPSLDLAFWAGAMRWAMLFVLAGGAYWLIFSVLRSDGGSAKASPSVPEHGSPSVPEHGSPSVRSARL